MRPARRVYVRLDREAEFAPQFGHNRDLSCVTWCTVPRDQRTKTNAQQGGSTYGN
jgi:hypothetical protein